MSIGSSKSSCRVSRSAWEQVWTLWGSYSCHSSVDGEVNHHQQQRYLQLQNSPLPEEEVVAIESPLLPGKPDHFEVTFCTPLYCNGLEIRRKPYIVPYKRFVTPL